MNCFHVLFIQQRVVKESVQKITLGELLSDVRALKIESTNLGRISAPNNSRRGVDCFLIGATRVLETMRFVSTSLLLCSVRRKTTAAGLAQCQSARLPPMWPGFDSRTRCHMWAEFVGSLLCSERFFSGYSRFPLSSKTKI